MTKIEGRDYEKISDVEENPFSSSLNTISVQKPAVERGGGGLSKAPPPQPISQLIHSVDISFQDDVPLSFSSWQGSCCLVEGAVCLGMWDSGSGLLSVHATVY